MRNKVSNPLIQYGLETNLIPALDKLGTAYAKEHVNGELQTTQDQLREFEKKLNFLSREEENNFNTPARKVMQDLKNRLIIYRVNEK